MNIQRLFSVNQNNELSLPMSPAMAAEKFVEQQFIRTAAFVWRVHGSEKLNQIFERGEGWTGHDNLIVIDRYNNCDVCIFFVDTGTSVVPAYLWVSNDPKDKVDETPLYERQPFKEKLTKGQAVQLFEQCIADLKLFLSQTESKTS